MKISCLYKYLMNLIEWIWEIEILQSNINERIFWIKWNSYYKDYILTFSRNSFLLYLLTNEL